MRYLVLLLSLLSFSGCNNSNSVKILEGGLYSTTHGDKFRIVKVLKHESSTVHSRLYANTFDKRPKAIDETTLHLGTINDKNFGIGHIPMPEAHFFNSNPEFIKKIEVSKADLEGYNLWRQSQ